MTLFVDTSALLAFLDADQPRHADTVEAWRQAIDDRDRLVTSNRTPYPCHLFEPRLAPRGENVLLPAAKVDPAGS